MLLATINSSIILIALDIFRRIHLDPLTPANTNYLLRTTACLLVGCASVLSPERTFNLSGTSNFDPPLTHGRWSRVLSGLECSQIRLLTTDLREEDGAFMEPSGRNQWQPVANARSLKSAETSQNRCRGLRPVAVRSAW
jgi:hypothetical protein